MFGLLVGQSTQSVKWNEQCQCVYDVNALKGDGIKETFLEFLTDYKTQMRWQKGNEMTHPNEHQLEEIQLTNTILHEIFNTGLVPLEIPNEKYQVIKGAEIKGSTEDVLQLKYQKEEYVIKITKTTTVIYITVRPLSSENVNIVELSKKIFQKRVLPDVWDRPLYGYIKGETNDAIDYGTWLPYDKYELSEEGKVIEKGVISAEIGFPVGKGRYGGVGFVTNKKFVCFKIIGAS